MPAGLENKKPLGVLAFADTPAATGQKFQSVMFKEKEQRQRQHKIKSKHYSSANQTTDNDKITKSYSIFGSASYGFGTANALPSRTYLKAALPQANDEIWFSSPNLNEIPAPNMTNENTYSSPELAILFGGTEKNNFKSLNFNIGANYSRIKNGKGFEVSLGISQKTYTPSEAIISSNLPEYGELKTTMPYVSATYRSNHIGLTLFLGEGKSSGVIQKDVNGLLLSDTYKGHTSTRGAEISYKFDNGFELFGNYSRNKSFLKSSNPYLNYVSANPAFDSNGQQIFKVVSELSGSTSIYDDLGREIGTTDEYKDVAYFKYNAVGSISRIENDKHVNQRNSGIDAGIFTFGVRYSLPLWKKSYIPEDVAPTDYDPNDYPNY